VIFAVRAKGLGPFVVLSSDNWQGGEMIWQTRLMCFVAGLICVVAAMSASVAADVGTPPPICLPSPAPSVSGVTSCPSGTPAQSPAQGAQSPQGAQTPPKTEKKFSVAATPELASSLAVEVNRIRRAHGLRALAISARLTNAATAHAQALAAAGQFTHAWPTTGKAFSSWIRGFYPARGYGSWIAGENLLWASPGFVPASAVQQWLNSPVHRRVLLSSSWREVGIGVVTAVAAPGAFGGRDVQIAAAEFGRRA
jgi:uncharacterized protein YkwD